MSPPRPSLVLLLLSVLAAAAAAARHAPATATALPFSPAPAILAATSSTARAAAAPPAAPGAPASPPVTPSPAARANDPWVWLERVRRSLAEAGATGAAFTQTYVPAGFTSGETENGSLSLQLPDCLRWDYREPYPKGFLLCGDLVHAWNPEDHTGRRYRVDRKNEPGLDLLLLGTGELRARYNATTRSLANGQVEIALAPRGRQGTLSDATLAIDPATLRVVGISYHDRQGNLTRFLITGYQRLDRSGQFAAPAGIRWQEQP
jgi:outer membrane lipoprotein-sorting protein